MVNYNIVNCTEIIFKVDPIEEAKKDLQNFINQRAKEANDNIAEMCDYLRFGKRGTVKDPVTGVIVDYYMIKEGTDHVFSHGIDYPLFTEPVNHLTVESFLGAKEGKPDGKHHIFNPFNHSR